MIWIAEKFRPEHRSALIWLNENSKSDVDFFGVSVRAIKIGDSQPAVEFQIAVEPDGWRRRSQSAAVSPKGERYRQYWEELIPMLPEAGHIRHLRSAKPYNYIPVPTGTADVVYGLTFRGDNRVGVDVYFDSDANTNQKLFEILLQDRDTIEQEIGEELSWQQLEDKKACRIAFDIDGSVEDGQDELKQLRSWMIEALGKLKRATQHRLQDAADGLNVNQEDSGR